MSSSRPRRKRSWLLRLQNFSCTSPAPTPNHHRGTAMSEKITDEHARRGAMVYIRQSSPTQVNENRESQRRQYGLAERARELGFQTVNIIDDDLGRSGSGLVDRPGFQKLVAAVCAGQVGAVLSIEASRLARNGRDWHHLIDLCGLVGTLVIDADGIYDPRLVNDRLLLGLKGTMSEFELNLLHQRSFEAIRSKAGRGELMFCLPIGLCWSGAGKIDLDPDRRVQESIKSVFRKFDALGSARQVLLWFRRTGTTLPAATYGDVDRKPAWKLPVYKTIHSIVTNPMYAGAYVFGRTADRTRVVDGAARKTRGHEKPREQWSVLIPNHHAGYIAWEEYERNQRTLAENAHMKKRMAPKAGRGGRALLAGLLRCRRCGRMLHVVYSGVGHAQRYQCRGAHLNHGEDWCISFGGLRPDQAVVNMLLDAVQPKAVEAALEAAQRATQERSDEERAIALELEQARYETRLAARRYEKVDPDNRLVAAELELRWNEALAHERETVSRLERFATQSTTDTVVNRSDLLALAANLKAVWDSDAADMKLKQRIVHLVIKEVVADVDEKSNEVVLLVHWAGGRHTELRVPKNKPGHHSHMTSESASDIVRRMAGSWPDEQIAATLNRLRLRTGHGNNWNIQRVYQLRRRMGLPQCEVASGNEQSNILTLDQAARRLGVSNTLVRKLIQRGVLPASQVAPAAPWEIAAETLDTPRVREAVQVARSGGRAVRERSSESRALRLPGFSPSNE
jgi:DNA invertase Pin-like site-specific DNA recombinase